MVECLKHILALLGLLLMIAHLFVVPPQTMRTHVIKCLEQSVGLQRALLVITLIGMCALMGDGVTTPAISSAYAQWASSACHFNDAENGVPPGPPRVYVHVYPSHYHCSAMSA